MLHSHALVWLAGNLDFATLRQRILHDNDFAQRIIRYLESIIVHSIDSYTNDNAEVGPADLPPSSKGQESDDDFYMRLATDSNAVAQKTQMHSLRHNATCFKYQSKGGTCRFGILHELVPHSYIDELDVIYLA